MFQCTHCNKKYSQNQSLYIHLKVKHKDVKDLSQITLHNFELQKQNFIQAEDSILLFFGSLSEKKTYSLQTLLEQNIYNPNSHAPGKNHFSSNSIAKNPYELLDEEQQIEQKINLIRNLNLYTKESEDSLNQIVIKQFLNLNSVLKMEYQIWYYADPYQQQLDFSSEFSLDNIPLLAKNYYKKNLKLQFPESTIFLLWTARFLKIQAFTDVLRIILFFLQQKKKFEILSKEDSKKSWQQFLMHLKKDKILSKNYQALQLKFDKTQYLSLGVLYSDWCCKLEKLLYIFKKDQ